MVSEVVFNFFLPTFCLTEWMFHLGRSSSLLILSSVTSILTEFQRCFVVVSVTAFFLNSELLIGFILCYLFPGYLCVFLYYFHFK